MEQDKKPLKVFSASAGSGKTYTLVKVYLSLILGKNPTSASKIMAMTFTNKAALEMKTRIIEALDKLINPEREGKSDKEKAEANKYLNDIADEFGIKKLDIQKAAKEALSRILHQYEDFNVMTIDKFNLRLIRSFAMDLDLDTNFRVVINEDEILQHVIDDLLEEIDPAFSSILSKMFFQISLNRIEEGKGWNFENELNKYASILKNETASGLINQLDDQALTTDRLKAIRQETELIRNRMESLVANFYSFFEPIQDDFKTIDGKKVNGNARNAFVKKMANFDVSDKKMSAGIFSDKLIELIEGHQIEEPIGSEIHSFYSNYTKDLSQLEEYQKISESYYYLILLKEIQKRLEQFRSQEQIIRISEFNKMISELLRNENSPFIYEKLGTRFEHFLLDEFQDTSRLQWLNIVPLLHESISHSDKEDNLKRSLIVGDPKQAIYRFRNGVAEQFVALPKIYNPENDADIAEKSRYFDEMGKKEKLEDNYRSNKDVVEFNNQFFTELIQFVNRNKEIDYSDYYKDVNQTAKKESRGFIEFVSLDATKEEQEDEMTSSIDFLLKRVKECIDDGYEKGDICVLGSKRNWCNDYAVALSQNGYSVVSVDSLSVDSEQYVQLCLLYLKWRNQPTNELIAKQFITKYFALQDIEEPTVKYASYFEKILVEEEGEQKEREVFNYLKFIEEKFVSYEEFFFPFQNLYTLLQVLYGKLKESGLTISELQNPYLHHLSDLAFDYDMNNGPDLNAFIDFYEQNGYKSSIQAPENKEAIKIMTIHKSKGLEFKVVIIPQINEEFMKSGVTASHLIQLGDNLAYTSLSKNTNSERLSEEYETEYRASLLDRLNLYYVAFTRAKERLYVMNRLENRKASDAYFGRLIHDFLNDGTFDNHLTSTTQEDGETTGLMYQLGERVKNEFKEEEQSPEFEPSEIPEGLWFPEIFLKETLPNQEEGVSEQIRYGNQLHHLLSEYSQSESVEKIVDRFLKKGWVEKQFETRLKENLTEITTDTNFQSLHENALRIMNEQTFIVSEEEILRPDKIIVKENETIIIDFKTGLPKKRDIQQVKNYCFVLQEAGYNNIKGLVLYTRDMQYIAV